MKNQSDKLLKIVYCALFAAIICVTTMLVRIPTTSGGYVHMGDCFVIICGWYLGAHYGFLAAATGSALADILGGYIIYAPISFLIKGLMALSCCLTQKFIFKHNRLLGKIVGAFIAGTIMVLGYFVFEAIYYGNIPTAAAATLPNCGQAFFGIVAAFILSKVFDFKRYFFPIE